MNPILEEKLAYLPTKPGVYQHKDADGKVLYVGKAKNLRSRVRSYFQQSRPKDGRIQILVAKIEDVEIIVTDNEAEALILENNLIKELKPRYNINLRDDKTYPYICIKKERFPRVFPTRRIRRDGSKYFGPYTDVKSMHLMLDTIRSMFRLRDCSLNLRPESIEADKFQVCLQYHIKKCDAPCVGYQSEADYARTIQQVEQLLNGKTQTLVEILEEEMAVRSAAMQFEEAAALRDRIKALRSYTERQKVVSNDTTDRDLFALAVDRVENMACGAIFKVREGKVIGRAHKHLHRIEGISDESLMQAFLENHYTETTFFPEEVLLAIPCSDPEPLLEFLCEHRGKKVTMRVPERGDKAGLIRMVESNARLLLEEWRRQKAQQAEGRVPHVVHALKRDLRPPHLPRRIECFDISHLGGTGIVASCVVFVDGRPKKKEYRTFKVRTVEEGKSDDFQSMREVVARRYARIHEANGPWPDLVVIDGGKGQLSSAVEALERVDAYGRFPVVGLAKRLEEVFFPGDTESVLIPRTSSSLQLLQRTRNEAHRFAVTFQRKQRQLKTLHSELMDIPGVGDKSVRKLLQAFGSVKRIRLMSEPELSEVVGASMAARIRNHLDENAAQQGEEAAQESD